MADSIHDKHVSWFVLNHIGSSTNSSAQKAVERFNSGHNDSIELFAPTYVVREEKNGIVKFRSARLTFHYVFVRGDFASVKMLCSQSNNGFSFVLNRGSECRYATIGDRAMAQFKNIARAYKNCLPCFSPADMDLEDGDLVEVVNGPFAGLTGRYMPKAKSKSGNIVLNVYGKLMTIAYDVNSVDVRVLEFSRNSTRVNDQIDAFIPYLLKALRLFAKAEELTPQLVARLSVFCGRMGIADISNRKVRARLQLLLYAANLILGKNEEAMIHLAQFDEINGVVTNEWTRGLNDLILSVIDNDRVRVQISFDRLKELEASSKMRRSIMDEYCYYIASM